MPSTERRFTLALVLALSLGLSWLAREIHHRRVARAPAVGGGASWVTTDPDSHYQMRRVERALVEGAVAERDPALSFPDGSAIPWPPYYVRMASAVLAPFAPEDPIARHDWIERSVASLPIVFGVLTTVVAVLAGFVLAGTLGALGAGVLHALAMGSIAYSKSGNGDHHAWISLLAGGMLLAFTQALRTDALSRPRAAAGWGALAGALAGIALGSWVASLLHVIEIQLALGVLLVVSARERRLGLAAFGLAFHLAALALTIPAVLSSPWSDEHPWSVVDLTWFHPAFLALGALVFVPLLALRSTRALRAYPALVAMLVLALAALVVASELPFAVGVREGFRWVSRADEFMGSVRESRPLIGPGAGASLFEALGYGALALPIAWVAMTVALVRGRKLELLPWAVAVPLLALQAAGQARFAEALALPMAVALAWGAVKLVERARAHRSLAVVAVLVLAALAQFPTLASAARRLAGPEQLRETPAALGVREMCEWLRASEPSRGDASVLAAWNWGHTIEWAAGWPSVATNFGSYVGEEGFRAPSRFFMSEDPREAEAILERHRARFVLLDSGLPNALNSMIQSGAPERRDRYVGAGSESGGQVRPAWFRTLGARLMFDGAVFAPGGASDGALDFLRLVHVAPLRDPTRTLRSPSDVSPAGWIWERVRGATIEARGEAGDTLTIRFDVRYEQARHSLAYEAHAAAGADGVARLRVPYSTDAANGDGVVQPGARWSIGSRGGALAVTERAVLEGAVLRVP